MVRYFDNTFDLIQMQCSLFCYYFQNLNILHLFNKNYIHLLIVGLYVLFLMFRRHYKHLLLYKIIGIYFLIHQKFTLCFFVEFLLVNYRFIFNQFTLNISPSHFKYFRYCDVKYCTFCFSQKL